MNPKDASLALALALLAAVGLFGAALWRLHRRQTVLLRSGEESRRFQELMLTTSEAADLQAAIDTMLSGVCEASGWPLGVIFLPEPNDLTLAFAGDFTRLDGEEIEEFRAASRTFRPHRGVGLPGRVWAAREALWLPDLGEETNYPRLSAARTAGLRTGMGVPVLADGQVVAVLEFYLKERRKRDDRFLRLVSGAGAQLGSIIQRKRAKEALRLGEARLRRVVKESLVGLVFTNLNGRIIDANPAFLTLTGHGEEDLKAGRLRWSKLLPPSYELPEGWGPTELDELAFSEAVGLGVNLPIERELQRADGTSVPCLLGFSVLEGEPAEAVGFALDQSERHRSERLKREFVSTVSHELRTPLTAILGSLGVALSGGVGVLPSAMLQLLGLAQRNGERLLSLVNDLLDMERIQAGQLALTCVPFELMEQLRHALAVNQAFGDQFKIRFCLETPSDLVWVHGDAQRLQQVMANLLSNAAKFSPSGAEVRVKVALVRDRAEVSVQDQGPGIPIAFHERVFQPFAQADGSDARQKGGAGLGLSISYRLVKAMGGELRFVTEVERGTTFSFDLLCTEPPQEVT